MHRIQWTLINIDKNIYIIKYGVGGMAGGLKPGLAWKRKAPLVMSWNLIHPRSYWASGLGPRCARPRPRLRQQLWIPDFAKIEGSNLKWLNTTITSSLLISRYIKLSRAKFQCHTIQLRLPRLGVAKYRSTMEHELTSSEMTWCNMIWHIQL